MVYLLLARQEKGFSSIYPLSEIKNSTPPTPPYYFHLLLLQIAVQYTIQFYSCIHKVWYQ